MQGVEQLVYNIQSEIFFYSQKPVNYNAKLQSLCTSNNKKTKNNKKIHEPVLFLYSVDKCPLCYVAGYLSREQSRQVENRLNAVKLNMTDRVHRLSLAASDPSVGRHVCFERDKKRYRGTKNDITGQKNDITGHIVFMSPCFRPDKGTSM